LLFTLDEFLPELTYFPSIRFGLECALRAFLSPVPGLLFNNSFARGERAIPINGLIWMGAPEWMQDQVAKKIKEGYSVLKFKIGAIDWKQEHEIIQQVRKHFGPELLTIRVDANGGFTESNVRHVLNELRDLSVHSIEQPVAVNEIDLLAAFCKEAIVPIALDESLIPCYTLAEKVALLDRVSPQFIILKPSLHGGISGVQTWIELATARGIGWWMTSALESNIGLTAVAQFAAEYPLNLPQGLGTGGLFATNFKCGLSLSQDQLTHHLPVHG
jgi:o-succinylbenzoate synthase